jgi:hypothetical protein
MWRDICIANRDTILAALDGYLSDLEAVRGMVEASDGPGLGKGGSAAQRAREVDQPSGSRVLYAKRWTQWKYLILPPCGGQRHGQAAGV